MILGMSVAFVELCFRVVTPLTDILKDILKFLRHGNYNFLIPSLS